MNIWELLEIEPTTDKKAIRRAYAARTRVIHPEEKPEEFKLLRMAYEAALQYAEYAAGRRDIFESLGESVTTGESPGDESISQSAEEQPQDREEAGHSELLSYFTENREKQKRCIDTFMQHWKEIKNPGGDSEEAKWWREYLDSEDFRSIQWNQQIVSLIADEIDDKFFCSTNEIKILFWEAYGFQADEEEKYQGEQQKLWKVLYPAYEYYERVFWAKEYDRKSKKTFWIFAACAVVGISVIIGIIAVYYSKVTDNERQFIVQYMTQQYPETEFSVPERSKEQDNSGVTYTLYSSAHPEFLITAKIEYPHWDNEDIMQVTEEDYGVQLLEYYAPQYGLKCGRIEYRERRNSYDGEIYGVLYYPDIEQIDSFCEKAAEMFNEQEELQSIPSVAIGTEDAAFPEVLIQGGVDNFPFADVQLYDLRIIDAAELESLLQEAYITYMFQYESWKLTPQDYREWGAVYEKLCEQWEDKEGFWYNVQDKDTGEVLCRIYIPTYEYIDSYYHTDGYSMPVFKKALTSGNAYYYLLEHGAYVIVDEDEIEYKVKLNGATKYFGRQSEEKVEDLTAWY